MRWSDYNRVWAVILLCLMVFEHTRTALLTLATSVLFKKKAHRLTSRSVDNRKAQPLLQIYSQPALDGFG